MRVQFYLNEVEVQRVFFKQFSSHCTIWLKLLEQYAEELRGLDGVLRLVYDPSRNIVHPEYDTSDTLLSRIHEVAIELSIQCFVYLPTGRLVDRIVEA